MSEPVRPLEEAIAAIERRAANATEAEIDAAHTRLGAIIDSTDGDDSREAGIRRQRASLDYACLIGFEGAPRENLWRIVNKLGALLGKEGLRREPYRRQQLAAALVYISKGWNPGDDDTAYCGVAGVRASIVADPGDFPTLWRRDSGSDWAEYSSEDMSPEVREAFFGDGGPAAMVEKLKARGHEISLARGPLEATRESGRQAARDISSAIKEAR